jgi:hypothetical protein
MPQSVYQTTLKSGLVQADFHPKTNRLLLLSKSGELLCKTITGEDEWSIRLECDPHGFAVNAGGDQIAVLGDEILIFYHIWSGNISTAKVGKKNRQVQAFQNCVFLTGYDDLITMVAPSGKVINSFSSDGLIRQFKVIPTIEQIMIHTEDKKLQCFDMSGEIQWELEKTVLTGNFVVSADGEVGYFIRYPQELIKFSLLEDNFFRVDMEAPPKLLGLSADGGCLIVIDSENQVTLYDRNTQPTWRQKFDHSIRQISVSSCSAYFLVVDQDGVLHCFVTDETTHPVGDFFEFNDQKRMEDKEVLWDLQPGLYQKVHGFNLLTLNPSRSHVGIVGLDGQIYFIDENGQACFKIRAPFQAEVIGMDAGMQSGYIYGDQQILLMDLTSQSTSYILFNESLYAPPLVNYYSQQIVLLSKEAHIAWYAFSGELLNSVPLKQPYQRGLSCEAFGVVLYNDHELTGFSENGDPVFKLSLPAPIVKIDWVDGHVVGALKDNQIFSLNLLDGQAHKGKFLKRSRPFTIASTQPFLLIEDDDRLHCLDVDLSTISRHSIYSKDSRFMVENKNFIEITKRKDGLYCMDDQQRMIWRVSSPDPINEFALTRNGLIMVTEDRLRYVAFKNAGQQRQRSDFLEF